MFISHHFIRLLLRWGFCFIEKAWNECQGCILFTWRRNMDNMKQCTPCQWGDKRKVAVRWFLRADDLKDIMKTPCNLPETLPWMNFKQAGKHFATSSEYVLVRIVKSSNPDWHSNNNKVVKGGFSQLHIIKTKKRSRLPQTHLSALIHISLSKMTMETLDPKADDDLWMETVNHRLNQGLGGASSSSSMQGAEAEDFKVKNADVCRCGWN